MTNAFSYQFELTILKVMTYFVSVAQLLMNESLLISKLFSGGFSKFTPKVFILLGRGSFS